MIRVADFISRWLADRGAEHVFMVTGGGAMHLNDAFGRERRLEVVCCHHEQACAIAAESYFRLTNRVAVVNVTSGPGGTNAITGVWGAWVDSLAVIVVSGNVRHDTMARSTGLPLRQLGDQEADIVSIVGPITKYAAVVVEPRSIRRHLERAWRLAHAGRPGPVWLDIPMNVQGALIDPEGLDGDTPPSDEDPWSVTDARAAAIMVLEAIRSADRPVFLASSGVRVSGAHAEFLQLVEKLGIPVTTAWNSHDLLWNSHRCYAGRPGTLGDRAGNFVVQNADLVVAMGCRLSIRQVGYNWENFAPSARLIAIDIDRAELEKPTIRVDVPVHANVRDIIREMLDVVGDTSPGVEHESWLAWCRERVARYPTVLPEYWESKGPANPYCFVAALFSQLAQGEVVVCADGTACAVTFHAAVLREGQRLYHNSGSAPMGYDLPAAIGACFARGRKPVTCLAGDGSIMMNLQELQTIATHRLPIRIFVLNNGGYHSIRQTQHAYFPDSPVGFDRPSGVGFPDFELLARAFSIRYSRCSSNAELVEAVENVLATDGPMICEVLIDQAQPFAPKLSSRKNQDGTMVSSRLKDMSPFLSREELSANMLPPSFRFRR